MALLPAEADAFGGLWREYWQTRWHHLPSWRDHSRFEGYLSSSIARKLTPSVIADYPAGKHPFLGVLNLEQDGAASPEAGVLEFPEPGHLLTIAPTRTGKGTCQIIPNLMMYGGSCLVIDIKGENYDATASYRKIAFAGARVIRFAPFSADTARYNPLDFIRTSGTGPSADTFDDARLLAEMLLPTNPGSSEYWDKEAQNFLTALILFVVCQYPVSHPRRTMREVVDLLTRAGAMVGEPDGPKRLEPGHKRVIAEMVQFAGTINYVPLKALGWSMLEHEDKVRLNILSTCKAGMWIWLSEHLTRATATSDFRFSDLKASMCRPIEDDPAPTTIYIVIPPEFVRTYRAVLRVMIGLAAIELTRPASWLKPGARRAPPCPVMFMLDEFPTLGHMPPIADGLAYLAGYGVRIWTFAQNIGQLKDTYGDAWHNFPANAGATSFFGVNDPDTAEYVERLLGESSEQIQYYQAKTAQTTKGQNRNIKSINAGNQILEVGADLDAIDSESKTSGSALSHRFLKGKLGSAAEIRALPDTLQLVFMRNRPPILAVKMPHYEFELLKGMVGTWQA